MADKRVTDALKVVKDSVAALEAAIKAADTPVIKPPKLVKPPMLLLGAGKPPGESGGTLTPVPAGPNEAAVWLDDYVNVDLDFFGVSEWYAPKNTSTRAPNAGSYGINRYCAFSTDNYCTELTYLANGTASYTDFDNWVDFHAARGADVIFQVYINSHGSSTTLTSGQWANVVTKFNEFLTRANGRVKYVVMANEPLFTGSPGNNPSEPTSPGWPSRSATLYAEYTRVISQLIEQSAWAGQIQLIAPESMSLDSFRRADAIYVLESSAQGYDCGLGNGAGTKMKDFVDIIGYHGYHYTGGTYAPADGGYSLIQAYKSELAAIGWTGPIWDTEFMRTAGGSNFNDSWNVIVEQIGRRHCAEVASGVGHSCNFEWGSGGPNSHFNNNSAAGERARTWWSAYTNWWRAAPIGRITPLTDGRIRVTRSDLQSLIFPTNLTDGTLAPNP